MTDAAKSQTLNDAKDRLEQTLENLNALVTQKNADVMKAQSILDERAHLKERVAQLEALNAEHDVAIAHQALHSHEDALDKQAVIKLRDEYEKLKKSYADLESELFDVKKQLAANSNAQDNSGADAALKLENASLKEELSNKIRQVNALEREAMTSDALREKACSQIDGLIGRVETMVEQVNV